MLENNTNPSQSINREFKYDNKLHFYDMFTLIGVYECQSSLCDYAKGTIDDANYNFNYYKKATETQISLIAKKYAFITDGNNEIILYDVKTGTTINKYSAVKNYQIGIDGNYYIVKDLNDKWGVIKLGDTVDVILDYKYNFIGVHNKIKDGSNSLDSDLFVVYDSNGWKLVSNSSEDKSSNFMNSIYDYNDKYVITLNNLKYYISNINTGNAIMLTSFSYAEFIDNYIAVVDNYSNYYLINPETLQAITVLFVLCPLFTTSNTESKSLTVLLTLNPFLHINLFESEIVYVFSADASINRYVPFLYD